jgi:thioredoxin 1
MKRVHGMHTKPCSHECGPSATLLGNSPFVDALIWTNSPISQGANVSSVALTKDTFDQTVADNPLVLVDFWADWCGPCIRFGPVYEKVSETHPDIVFGKVDTEAEQDLAYDFQIRSIPTLMIFRDQILIFSQPGALPESALRSVIDQAKALDMDEVREKIAAGHEHHNHE